MVTDWITKIDLNILNWIHENLVCDFLDKAMVFVSLLGSKGCFFILVGIIFLFFPKLRIWGASILASSGLGFLFGNLLLKNIVGRIRPYEIVDGITLLVDKLNDFSFPSGHTLVAFEFFAVIYLMPTKKIYKIMTGILALLMGFSRLYLYVHYPSDVLAGMLLGILFGVMGVRIVNMIVEEKKAKKEGVNLASKENKEIEDKQE